MGPAGVPAMVEKIHGMTRVLRIINRFNLGGPTYNAVYLAKYLPGNYETLLIGGMKDESEESSEFIATDLGIKPVIISSMKRSINPFQDLAAYREIKRIIREFKPDIVHTHAAKAGALGRRAAFACNVPVTVHTFHGHVFHSYFGKTKTDIYRSIERKLAKRTDAIIAISEKQKEELVKIHRICDEKKTHIIPLGFDLDRFRSDTAGKRKIFRDKYGISDSTVAIGIVGRLVPVKNHALFLRSIRYVLDHSPKKIKAFIIGDGEEREKLQELCSSLNLHEHVIFTSWEKKPEHVYPGLDIVCLSSFNEGTPVSLIEAQAAGVPIVTTDTGGIGNVVEPGKTALLSAVNDEQGYCKNLLELVKDPAQRSAFSARGWDWVKDRFHYTRLVKDMDVLYTTLLSRSAR